MEYKKECFLHSFNYAYLLIITVDIPNRTQAINLDIINIKMLSHSQHNNINDNTQMIY